MHFPVADIETAVWVPPLTAFVISFFTSMGGVSGAFLLLPFQVSVLGYDSPSVSATNHVFNITAIPSGVYRYVKEKRMVWPLAWVVIIGTLPGVILGGIIRIYYLPDPKTFKLFAGVVLMYIGIRLVRDVLGISAPAKNPGKNSAAGPNDSMAVTNVTYTPARISFDFQGETRSFSTPGVLALSLVVGVVGGTYGIGGGAIIAPFLVTFFRLPVHAVAGAALMGTCLTSVAGVFFFQAMARVATHTAVAPDWLLGVLFGLGGVAGMYLGATCQRFVPARLIKGFLGGCVVFLAARYIIGYFA